MPLVIRRKRARAAYQEFKRKDEEMQRRVASGEATAKRTTGTRKVVKDGLFRKKIVEREIPYDPEMARLIKRSTELGIEVGDWKFFKSRKVNAITKKAFQKHGSFSKAALIEIIAELEKMKQAKK